MIFTCPSGHKTFMGSPAGGPGALPLIGAGQLAHCLTCNAERRFEWKPEPSAFTSIERSTSPRRLAEHAHKVTDEDLAEAFKPYGGVEAFEAALREDKQRQTQAAVEARWAAHGCTENDHDWTPHEGGQLCRRCHGWNAIVTL